MRIVEKTAGTFGAVTLDQVKSHLKLHSSITIEDVLIEEYIKSARELLEGGGNRLVLANNTVYTLYLEGWPRRGLVEIDRFPLVSVDSIKYSDTDGAEQTLVANTDYKVQVASESVVMINTPSLYSYSTHPIEIEFTAGYTISNFPGLARAALYQIVGFLHINREDKAQELGMRTWQRMTNAIRLPLYV